MKTCELQNTLSTRKGHIKQYAVGTYNGGRGWEGIMSCLSKSAREIELLQTVCSQTRVAHVPPVRRERTPFLLIYWHSSPHVCHERGMVQSEVQLIL